MRLFNTTIVKFVLVPRRKRKSAAFVFPNLSFPAQRAVCARAEGDDTCAWRWELEWGQGIIVALFPPRRGKVRSLRWGVLK